MKRIIILTADFGYGHRSAAIAISESLSLSYGNDCVVKVINPLNDPQAPKFIRDDQKRYDQIVKELPSLYKLGYQITDTKVAGTVIENTFTLILLKVIKKIIHQEKPDTIVCTYPLFQGILDLIYSVENFHIPLVTVVTDLATVNKLWFHPVVDLCVVPTKIVEKLAIDSGIPKEKIQITGIPVRINSEMTENGRQAILDKYGWNTSKFTVLAVGSKRVDKLYETIDLLNHSGLPIQLIIITGGDDHLYKQFQLIDWHIETHLYDYVDEIREFMEGADCVICKAGGLIVSESLASGLPMILISAIPGQETGNADYITDNNAGVFVKDPKKVLETVCHWVINPSQQYTQLVENAKALGRPNASIDVAKAIWNMV